MVDTKKKGLPSRVYIMAGACALIALLAYYFTIHPGVGPSLDSIELQIAALVDGVIHPPGSPQYLMLGSLFMKLLPFGNPALRLNFFSSLSATLAVFFTYLASYRLTRSRLAAAFGALVLAFSTRLWYQASIAELYALNAAYVAIVSYYLIAYAQTGRKAQFWAATAAYALSFGNHTSMLMLLPAYLYSVISTDKAFFFKPKTLLITAGIVAASALQYLYIPMRVAAGAPFCNYCPESGESLVDYLTGGPFKAWFFTLPADELFDRLAESMRVYARQFEPWGIFLIAVGLWELLRDQKKPGWYFLTGIVFEYAFVMTYVIPDWHDFMTPVYVLSAPALAFGLNVLWESVKPALDRIEWLKVKLQPYILAIGIWGIVAFSIMAHYDDVYQNERVAFTVMSETLTERMSEDAVIMMPGPASYQLYYSWAVRYTTFATERTASVPMITPVDIDPPPGPSPYYQRWADVSEEYSFRSLYENKPEVYVIDPMDPRFTDWGLIAICVPGTDAVAGYRLVSIHEGDVVMPLVNEETWVLIEPLVDYNRGMAGCWPLG